MSILATTIITGLISLAQAGANAVSSRRETENAQNEALAQADERARSREENRATQQAFAEQSNKLADRKFGLAQRKLESNNRDSLLAQKETNQQMRQLSNDAFSSSGILGTEMTRDAREMQRARLR